MFICLSDVYQLISLVFGVTLESFYNFCISSSVFAHFALVLKGSGFGRASRVFGRAVRKNVAAVKPSLFAVSFALRHKRHNE